MALRFTDIEGKSLFEFFNHEYPESLPMDIKVKLNKIEYPDDHYTNQIIGSKPGEISFSGKFYGSYFNGSDLISAKERSDLIEKLIKKVVVINYAVGGQAGPQYPVVIEEYNRKLVNYHEVEYELKLIPHQPQTRTKPGKVSLVSIAADGDGLKAIADKAHASAAKATSKASAAVKKAAAVTKSPAGTKYGLNLKTAGEAAAKVWLRHRGIIK